MPMGLHIDATALNLLQKDLQDMSRDLAGANRLRQAWERVRDEVMIPSINENFDSGGRPSWEPLADGTLLKDTGRMGGPLEVTGQMRRAATAKARFHIAKNEMTYGDWPARRWFGPVHDFGSGNGHIPARPFAFIHGDDVQPITDILMDWVEMTVNRNVKMRYP